MLYSRQSDAPEVYVIRISRQEVGVTTNYYFWFLSPVGALAKGAPDRSINMMHDKNNYTDPRLKFAERCPMVPVSLRCAAHFP